MKFSSTTIKGAAAAAIAAAGILTASPAFADPMVTNIGNTQSITLANGAEVATYTVKDLMPSGNNDGVYFADVTVTATKGTVTPNIGEFNARAANGTNYTAVLGNNADGLPAKPIPPGTSSSGRIYFQVNNGPAPTSVVYTPGGDNNNAAIWNT